jgi:hypothetical protein
MFHESDADIHRVDTTYEVLTKELPSYEKEFDELHEKLQKVLAWVASACAEGHDVATRHERGDFDVDWDLVRKAHSSDPNITAALDLAERYEDKLNGLRDDIWGSPLEMHLEDYAEARAAYDEARKRPVT